MENVHLRGKSNGISRPLEPKMVGTREGLRDMKVWENWFYVVLQIVMEKGQ
jgi:hypothetical protein